MSFINNVNGNIDISAVKDSKQADVKDKSIASPAKFEFGESDDTVKVEVDWTPKSKNTLKKEGKTRHMIAAQDGPDKGSKFYSDEDYDFFGRYKHNKENTKNKNGKK